MLIRSVVTHLFIICCLFIMVNITGCSEETEDNHTSPNIGAANFNLIWLDEDSDQRTPQAIGKPTINCNDKGISFIRVDVYNGSFDKYLTGETFPCTDGEGTVYGIASGKDRIFKVSGKNNKGKLLYEGEKNGIEIVTGKVKPVGLIKMYRSGNIPPTATIDTSEYDQNIVFIVGEKITFKGSGHDNEDGELTGDALVWTLDGNEIETGDTCTLSNLDIDSHKITLTVTDDDQATGHFSVTFSVKELDNENPEAIINLPLDFSKHDFASEIKFQGTGTDKESDTLIFEWDLDNEPLGTGQKFSKSDIPAGQHIVTLRVKDDAGGMGTATVRIEVLENRKPEATITQLPKDKYIQGEPITFIGTGTDKESTELRYTWYSSLEQKNIGTGPRLTINNLSVGTHTITLTVTDEHNGTGTATINVTILKNQLPVATITEPATGSTYIEGQSVKFSGTGTDSDGSVTGFQWKSSEDGNLGTKQAFTTSDLSVGTHTITLTVTDQYDGKGTDTVNITIKKNPLPVVNITKPIPGTYTEGEALEFSGTATDNDGPVTGFTWRSNIDDEIGTGPEFSTSDLSVGTHIITLSVKDKYDETGTDTVTITISKKPIGRFSNSIGMVFSDLGATFPVTFEMGSPSDEPEREFNERLHDVTLTQPFFMQTTEVTNAQYVTFLNDIKQRGPEGEPWFKTKEESDSSHITGSTGNFSVEPGYGNHPVINVTWYGAKAFADWLSKKEDKDYQLPTEAQWEYAARADTDTPFYFGDCLSTDQANYNPGLRYDNCINWRNTYRETTTEVASLPANAWGLYDMHGNVFEWCADWWAYSYSSFTDIDPKGPSSGTDRVMRGGSWISVAEYCRSARRDYLVPDSMFHYIGFRIALLTDQ